jgi:hypothetical protein
MVRSWTVEHQERALMKGERKERDDKQRLRLCSKQSETGLGNYDEGGRMYSFPGANHNLRRKRVRERTKLYNISTIVMVFSLCLAQQAQAGSISISNRNCAYQGLSKTNQTNFFLFAFGALVVTNLLM